MSEPRSGDPWEEVRVLPFGQWIELTTEDGTRWTGAVLPAHEFAGPRVLMLKLESGYNVGVHVGRKSTYRLLEAPKRPTPPKATATPPYPEEARKGGHVELLTTGGTIASRVDYETGGVRPVRDEAEILAFYPELGNSGSIRIVPVLDRLSEDIGPTDWVDLAGKVVEAFGRGAEGVVIAHGTDTLGFTAAGLSFLLADLPGPVVLVGAQRSPDRPSSDGPSNLRAAVAVARDRRLGEVVVVMHEGLSDGRFAIHRGTRVRKMHSSRRDAFESRNGPALGAVVGTVVELGTSLVRAPRDGPPRVDGPLDPRGGLLEFFPGLAPERAAAFLEDLRGVIIAGTGLGHVGSAHLPWIRRAVERGVVVAMTTQCLAGSVDPYVYATGRELLRAGVVFLDDLLPETAYAKLLWALGHADTPEAVRELLVRDRAGEFAGRRGTEVGA